MKIIDFFKRKEKEYNKEVYIQEVLDNPEKYPELENHPQIIATKHTLNILGVKGLC